MNSGQRWPSLAPSLPIVLLAVALGVLPFLLLTRPPATPVITLVNTGTHGLALVTDTRGRHLLLGGSDTRTAATTALDRHLPVWDRRLSLLLVPSPHPAYLPGALDLLERRTVAQASLLGLAASAHPALDLWQTRHPQPPLVGHGVIALGADTQLLLDTGNDPVADATLVVLEHGPVRLLLLFGDAAPLVAERSTADELAAPAVVVRMTSRTGPLPPGLQPPLVIALDGSGMGWDADGRRRISLAPGESLRIVLHRDRLLVQGVVGLDRAAPGVSGVP